MNESISFTWVIVGAVFLWLIVLIVSLISLFKRKDIAKPLRMIWLIIILFFPVVGLILYLVAGSTFKRKDVSNSGEAN